MEIIHSIILGAVQGITEFVPVSSSAHLILFPYLFNWDYNGLEFDVALHFGTFLAVITFFWKDWINIFKNAVSGKKEVGPYPQNTLWQIIVASTPAFLAGYYLEPYVEKYLHSPILLIVNLVIFGLLLWLTEFISKNTLKNENIRYSDSFIIGCAQAIALVPGVSRSGITMTAAKMIGFSKENAARFSFILGTPAVLGAFLYQLPNINLFESSLFFWVGVISSTIFGFFAIKYLIQYLKKGSFAVFALYRIILAILVLSFFLYR